LITESSAVLGAARPPAVSAADVRDWSRLIDLENDSWLAEAGGELAGTAVLVSRDPGVAEAHASVSPRFVGRGLGTRFLDLMEARGRERGAARIRAFAPALDTAGRALLESRAYRHVRSYYHMGIDLIHELPAPEWPEGIELTLITPELERKVHAAITEAFRDEFGFVARTFEAWRAHRLGGDSFDAGLWFVALDGDEVAGVAACARRGEEGYVDNVAVREPWRRRGLGLALLLTAFAEFRSRGERFAGLGVDSENPTGATRLYERAGMKIDWQDDAYEREL
jgi:ribosomal protein S18 acetylase RimI-like enzyme